MAFLKVVAHRTNHTKYEEDVIINTDNIVSINKNLNLKRNMDSSNPIHPYEVVMSNGDLIQVWREEDAQKILDAIGCSL